MESHGVGGESAQSHLTRDLSYTHLNAMNSNVEAISSENVCHKLPLIRVFAIDSFMFMFSQSIHSTVGPFFLNVYMTITLRNADIWRMAALELAKGRPQPYINLYETHRDMVRLNKLTDKQ